MSPCSSFRYDNVQVIPAPNALFASWVCRIGMGSADVISFLIGIVRDNDNGYPLTSVFRYCRTPQQHQ